MEEKKKAHIIIDWNFSIVGTEGRAVIHIISLSPVAYEEKLKFGVAGEDEQQSFSELRKRLGKVYFKRKDRLHLFVVNPENEQRQNFSISISEVWPEHLEGGKNIIRRQPYEITPILEKIEFLFPESQA